MENKTPKVFISYSWTSQEHQNAVIAIAERLTADGVEVVVDKWDLKEGQDKYAFMEKMVNDDSITKVLILSDAQYAAKADARSAGVGTETQIISEEVYSQADQEKFVPIVMEYEADKPCLPTYLQSRIWIDFSTPENSNKNWEKLVRLLYGKPLHQRPSLGNPPSYIIADDSSPADPAAFKFATLKQAVLEGKFGAASGLRRDFLNSCYDYVDAMRIRQEPDVTDWKERILKDCTKLKTVRDHIVNWILLECDNMSPNDFADEIIEALERLLKLKEHPSGVNSWGKFWLEAHSVFVYEVFLYTIAALIKARKFYAVKAILESRYGNPDANKGDSVTFRAFFFYSDNLQVLAPKGQRLYAPAAEVIDRQADRTDLPLSEIVQADLLILMMAFVKGVHWFPQTIFYSSHHSFPLFVRAEQQRGFQKLVQITGVEDANQLRQVVRAEYEQFSKGYNLAMSGISLWQAMNMDKLDSC